MLDRFFRKLCYTEHSPTTQPKWAQRAVRIERPVDTDKSEVAA